MFRIRGNCKGCFFILIVIILIFDYLFVRGNGYGLLLLLFLLLINFIENLIFRLGRKAAFIKFFYEGNINLNIILFSFSFTALKKLERTKIKERCLKISVNSPMFCTNQ